MNTQESINGIEHIKVKLHADNQKINIAIEEIGDK
jgi:hypothetical protein